MESKDTIGTNKSTKFLVIYIALIIFSIILLIIGQNNIVGWLIFTIAYIGIYFSKGKLLKTKHTHFLLICIITITILTISFAFTRPFPSIRGILLASSEMLDANRKGKAAEYIKPTDINSFIAKQRHDSEEIVKNYIVPNDIDINKLLINNINCEWVSMKNAPTDKVIIYLHGGAYITGSLNTSRPFAVRLSKATGFKVLVVEYALAPEYPYPTCLNQTLDVYHWLLTQGISPSNIAIVGDSAGGGLEFATVLALKDKNESLPGALVLISPWLDLTPDPETHGLKLHQGAFDWYDENAKLYAEGESLFNKSISPMYGDYKGFPPLLIHAGDVDILINDIRKAANKAKDSGVDVTFKEYKRMYHDFTTSGDFIPESKESVKLISQFIHQHIK